MLNLKTWWRLTVCGPLLLALLPLSVQAQGVVVLAGGGAEGNQGDLSAWSYRLYRKLLDNGDRNGDNVVSVAILTTLLEVNDPSWYAYAEASPNASPPGLGLTHAQALAQALADDAWLPNYFSWIGTTLGLNVQAFNVEVSSTIDANDAARVGGVATADAVFIKGGDQGDYYDRWNDTLLESHIRYVLQTLAGAVGGTSAGAMSQAQYCFCGGADLISADVLADAKTPYLDDVSQPGTSGIHSDFLNLVPGVIIDTHFTQRGRMGRLLGVLGRAIDDSGDHRLLGIGIDQKTGVAIRNGIAEVIGTGEVAFFKELPTTTLLRDPGRPLFYTDLALDRLTEGWRYQLTGRFPLTTPLPAGVIAVSYPGDGPANSGALSIDGSIEGDANRFEWIASYAPNNYALGAGSGIPRVNAALGFTRSGTTSTRAAKQETLFRALYDTSENVGVLAFSGGTLARSATDPDVLSFNGSLATIVIDAKTCQYKGLSPAISSYASAGGSLRAAALTHLRVHVIGESTATTRGAAFNSRLHTIVGGPPNAVVYTDGFED